jgi:hypothetical protein
MRLAEKVSLLIVAIFVAVGVYMSRVDLSWYEGFYVREDGLIEWLTVAALLLSSFTCFYRAKILASFRSPVFILCLILGGFICLFGVGEEISWGQRIFDWKSPEFFLSNNSQGETNIHNLVVDGKKINKIIFGTFLGICIVFYFLILPFLYRKLEKVKSFVNKFAIPIPKWGHVAAYLALALACEFIAGGKKGEILEFGGCWIFALMLLSPLNTVVFSRKSFER